MPATRNPGAPRSLMQATVSSSRYSRNRVRPQRFQLPDQLPVTNTLRFSDDANAFQAKKDNSGFRVQISFEYLEPRQGAVIEILHTSAEWNAEVLGKIKGVPKGVREVPSESTLNSTRYAIVGVIGVTLALILFAAIGAIIWAVGGPIPIRITLTAIVMFLTGWAGVVGWRRVNEPRKLSLKK